MVASLPTMLNLIFLFCFFYKIIAFNTVTASSDISSSFPSSLPKTYEALVADAVGDAFADVARVKCYPIPTLKSDEALIRVVYAGINGGCETFRARGDYAFKGNRDAEDSFALGAEGVGIVAAVGSDVKNVAVGDAVCFLGSAFAEYSKCSAKMLMVIPEAKAEYVGLRISALTSFAMLEGTGKIVEGETVLVTAAAGGAGHFAVQCAKMAGCTVIGTCSSPAKEAALKKLGCDHIINYKKQDVKEELQRIAPDGIDVVLEGVGGSMLQTSLDAMSPKGRLLQIGYISEYPHNKKSDESKSNENELFASDDIFWNRKTIKRGEQTIYGNAWPSEPPAERMDRILKLYADGKLQSLVDEKEFNGLNSISPAIDHMLSGKTIGKVVVKLD